MKIVIIGSGGQLGSDCCNILSSENETIGCDLPRVDIGSRASVDNYLNETQPDVIVNCAAYTNVDGAESDRAAAIAVNAALGLMEPTGSGIGGDLFAIVWDNKTQKLYGLNASGRSPRRVPRGSARCASCGSCTSCCTCWGCR